MLTTLGGRLPALAAAVSLSSRQCRQLGGGSSALRRFPSGATTGPAAVCHHHQLRRAHAEAAPPPPDRLYSTLVLEVRAHDDAVLDSYTEFFTTATRCLGVELESVDKPEFDRPGRHFHWWFNSALKSAFVHKKHKVQYEIRTYSRRYTLRRLTGSTAGTLLEYCERQLPEGVAMKVTKTEALPLPSAIEQRLRAAGRS